MNPPCRKTLNTKVNGKAEPGIEGSKANQRCRDTHELSDSKGSAETPPNRASQTVVNSIGLLNDSWEK